MSSPPVLRRLTEADLPIFDAIRTEMLRCEPDAFGSTLARWQARPAAEKRQWLATCPTFAIVADGAACAVAAFRRLPGARQEHRAEVVSVYTRPEARRRGHQIRLLTAMEAEAVAQGIVQLELQAPIWNTAALAAYERAGYARIGILPRALKGPDGFVDDVLMVRRLDTDS